MIDSRFFHVCISMLQLHARDKFRSFHVHMPISNVSQSCGCSTWV